MKNLITLNSKRTKQGAFAILITLLMTLSFIANVGAEIVDLTPDYAKSGDLIDVLSWDIVGPIDNTSLTQIHLGYSGTNLVTDMEYVQFYANNTLLGTVYQVGVWALSPNYLILENDTVTITMKIKIADTGVHGNHVDGYIVNYVLTLPGANGTDGPADPAGFTIIDNHKPAVVSATAVPDPAKAGPVTVTVEFSEAMDMGVGPAVQVTGLISGPYTVTGDFLDPDTWEGELTISGDPAEVATAYISVSGGQDFVGNVMEDAPTAGSFQVDTVGPNVVSITASDLVITDADIGNLFEVTVAFDEDMDMLVDPTVSFTPDVTATLPSLDGSWTDGTHYVVGCLIADGNQEVAHVGVNIDEAQDIAGNLQGSVGVMQLFAIDNKNPTVDIITVSDDMISDADFPGTFEVTATFSEAMDKSVPPAVSFTPGIPTILTEQSGTWDDDGMVYTANYTIADGDVEVTGVDVTVNGAKDLAGNSLVSKTEENLFSIDMLAPMAPYIFPVPPYINIANQGAYPVSGQAEPGSTVEVMLTDGAVVLATGTGSADPMFGFFTIAVNASILQDGPVGINAKATDAAGNIGPWTWPITVTKDTFAPIVSITIADPINLNNVILVPVTITSNENGNYTYVISDGDVTHDITGNGGITMPVSFNVDLQILVDGNITADASVKDAAGNIGNAPQDTATKDTVKPNVLSCQFSDTLISEADADGVFTVTVTYDEPMDPAFYPDITFNPATPGALIFSDEAWSSDTVYTANYTIVDMDEEVTVYVHIIGGSDLVGNTQVPFTASQGIDIDTIAPTPYMISISLIDDADGNGIANIGDTLRVEADMTLHPDTASVTADLHHYGGSETEALTKINGAWTVDFMIVDSPTGIDVGDYDPLSAVTATATDDVGNTATATSYPLISDHGVDSLAPEPLTGLTATAIAAGKIRLDWTASVALDLTSYNIYRDTAPDPTTLVATGVKGESWTDEGSLADGQTYYYRMKSVDDADNIGDYSDQASATSDSMPPIAPTLDAPLYINIANQTAYSVSGLAELGSTVEVRLTDTVDFAMATGPADAMTGEFTIAVDASGLTDGGVSIDARATDTVGNTGPYSANITRTKDTVEPTVTITIEDPINLANVGEVPVTITSNESGTYSYDVGGITGSEAISAGMPIDLFLDLNGLADGTVTADASVEDAAGNIGHAPQDTAIKDTIAPTVTIAIPEYINLANVGEVPVTITSDQNGPYDYNISDGTTHVTGNGDYTGTPISLSLNLNGLADGPVTADASVEDAAGNVGHAEDTATKDTVEPAAVDFHVSDILISDADVPGPFEVIVNFSESMDTTFVPDIDFIPSVSSTLDLTDGSWSDLDTVYTATFEIFDAGVEILNVNLTIAGFVDIAGNFAFEQKNGTDVFDIDTKNPTVVDLEISDFWIREDDIPGTFNVTVDFNEAMDASVIPDIEFEPEVSSTLVNESGVWSNGNMTYTFVYDIADADVIVEDVDVKVSGVRDLAGNSLDPDPTTEADLFDIDTYHQVGAPEYIDVWAEYSAPSIVLNANEVAWPDHYSEWNSPENALESDDQYAFLTWVSENVSQNMMILSFDAPPEELEEYEITSVKLLVEQKIVSDFSVLTDDRWVFGVGSKQESPMSYDTWIYRPGTEEEYTMSIDITYEGLLFNSSKLSWENVTDMAVMITPYAIASKSGEWYIDNVWIEVNCVYKDEGPSITIPVGSEAAIYAYVTDAFGDPVPETKVSFETNPIGTVIPKSDTTDGGKAETTLTSKEVGTATVTATAGMVEGNCNVTFVIQTLEIELSQGWNLISVPRELDDSAIETVFDATTSIEKVYTYQDGNWSVALYNGTAWINPISEHPIDDIDDGRGYWVYASEQTTVTISLKPLGIAPPPYYTLTGGWNMIGYTSMQLEPETPVNVYLTSLDGKWISLYRSIPEGGLEISKPSGLGFKNFELGIGYWIYLNALEALVP